MQRPTMHFSNDVTVKELHVRSIRILVITLSLTACKHKLKVCASLTAFILTAFRLLLFSMPFFLLISNKERLLSQFPAKAAALCHVTPSRTLLTFDIPVDCKQIHPLLPVTKQNCTA